MPPGHSPPADSRTRGRLDASRVTASPLDLRNLFVPKSALWPLVLAALSPAFAWSYPWVLEVLPLTDRTRSGSHPPRLD